MGAALLVLNSCTYDILPEGQAVQQTGDAHDVTFTARSFVRGGMDTRTVIGLPEDLNDPTQGSEFVWTAGDTIGIAPSSGAQAYFVIGEGAESNKATFDGGAWALKTGEASDYAAYYPFIGDIYLDRTKVPVNYLGQTYRPAKDNKLTSLAPFDYMAAKPSQATGTDNVSFQFKHLGSLVEVQFALPKAGTVNSFYLTASEKVLPVKGTFDLTADEVAITATDEDKAYTIPVAVEGLATTAGNQTVSVFFLMPPADLSEATLIFTVDYSYKEGEKTVRENLPFTIADGEDMEAEKWYTYAATAMTLVDRPEAMAVTDNYSFASYINDALGQLGGIKLRFVTGSAVTSDVEVDREYDEEGEVVVSAYAVRTGEWLEVHTLAKEFVLSESAGGMFNGIGISNFALLEELDLSGLNTSAVTDMCQMFSECYELTSITFGDNFDTSNVTDMSCMFQNCEALESLDLSKFDTSEVMDMSSMFFNCYALESLDLSKFDTSEVMNMNSMFSNCYALTSLDLTGFTFAEGVDCTGMFGYVGQNYAETGNKTPIYVTQEGYTFLNEQSTYIEESNAELKVKE